MTQKFASQIELTAAESLVRWKNQFANLVRAGANEIAVANGCEEIRWQDYQQAAEQAIQELGKLIKTETNPNERRNAA